MPASRYAHSRPDQPQNNWHKLSDHLNNTARLAQQFAAAFGTGEWGRLAGLWHDLGKYAGDFQSYLSNPTGQRGPRHAIAGAIHAVNELNGPGKLLAYPIAGHHTGLNDWQNEFHRGLEIQLDQDRERLAAAFAGQPPEELLKRSLPSERPPDLAHISLWIRMIFSCLVDADFLDTENFMQREKAIARGGYSPLAELLGMYTTYMKEKQTCAPDTPLNRSRNDILRQCLNKAACSPAIYTLTVPTGGGKTLSSLGFALHHAVQHGKQRVIYVIPYTSIIEQTAEEFRKIFGEAVIEHHSNIDADENRDEYSRQRLASENWDAPLIVTTTVQFFESLFANRSSRCRKIHNIVNSVVILDEAQLLPPDFLNPILDVIKELQRHYGVTFVLCTATQPAFTPQEGFTGLPGMVEIMDEPGSLYRQLKRVAVQIPDRADGRRSWDELAEELTHYESALCIVNRRDDARELWEKMPPGTVHLSGRMCGAHRSAVIDEIKKRLDAGMPTRVISTQLVEAGVDVDFPVVYRAIAGLDSIAQAAGRCNREGRLQGLGKVVVFDPPSDVPPGHLRMAADIGREIVAAGRDPLAPENYEPFFRQMFWLKGDRLDRHNIMRDLAFDGQLRFSFRTAAEKFRIIADEYAPVLVRYGAGEKWLRMLEKNGPQRWLLRKLQRYVVTVPRYEFGQLLAEGEIVEVGAAPGVYAQGYDGLYHPFLGLLRSREMIAYKADDLIV